MTAPQFSAYEKLTDREIDVLIAERLFLQVPCDAWECGTDGSDLVKTSSCDHKDNLKAVRGSHGVYFTGGCYPTRFPNWEGYFNAEHAGVQSHFSSDDNDVRLVRDRVAKLGLQQYFMEVFLRQESKPPSMFNAMQQAPREQCIAALLALDSQEKPNAR